MDNPLSVDDRRKLIYAFCERNAGKSLADEDCRCEFFKLALLIMDDKSRDEFLEQIMNTGGLTLFSILMLGKKATYDIYCEAYGFDRSDDYVRQEFSS